MWEAFVTWVFLVVTVTWLVKTLTFIFHILLGLAVLMWFTVYTVFAFFYNCIYNILYMFGATALGLFCKPFVAAGAFLGRLGTIIFNSATVISQSPLLHCGFVAFSLYAEPSLPLCTV